MPESPAPTVQSSGPTGRSLIVALMVVGIVTTVVVVVAGWRTVGQVGAFQSAASGGAGHGQHGGAAADALDSDCTTLRILAAPAVVPALEAMRDDLADDGASCLSLTITEADGRQAVGSLARTAPHVWIPGDAVWVSNADPSLMRPSDGARPVLATSPVHVVAGIDAVARLAVQGGTTSIGWADLADVVASDDSLTLTVEEPAESSEGLVAMGGINDAVWDVAGRNAASGAVTRAFESARVVAPAAIEVTPGDIALAAEHALMAAGGPPAGSVVLAPQDYTVMQRITWVDTTVDDGVPAIDAGRQHLLSALTGPAGHEALAQAHLRGPDMDVLADSTWPAWVPALTAAPLETLTGHHAEHVFAVFYKAERVADLHVVVDVSNSMWAVPPDGDRPLLAEVGDAVLALADGLPDEAQVEVWEFGVRLDPPVDHRVVFPLAPLSPQARQSLAERVAAMRPIDTGTGLHDTVLAAYREARDSGRPGVRSQVILFTDGRNEADPGSPDLAQLRTRLDAEADPARPVSLAVVVYGPDELVDGLGAALEPVEGSVTSVSTVDDVRHAFVHVAATGLAQDAHEGHDG